jgi:hypothetical protein
MNGDQGQPAARRPLKRIEGVDATRPDDVLDNPGTGPDDEDVFTVDDLEHPEDSITV